MYGVCMSTLDLSQTITQDVEIDVFFRRPAKGINGNGISSEWLNHNEPEIFFGGGWESQ